MLISGRGFICLKIEHNGCWMAFWLLPVTMIVQSIVYREMVFRMAVCFAALTLMLKKTQKRKMEIEAEPSDVDEL